MREVGPSLNHPKNCSLVVSSAGCIYRVHPIRVRHGFVLSRRLLRFCNLLWVCPWPKSGLQSNILSPRRNRCHGLLRFILLWNTWPTRFANSAWAGFGLHTCRLSAGLWFHSGSAVWANGTREDDQLMRCSGWRWIGASVIGIFGGIDDLYLVLFYRMRACSIL